MRILAFLMVLLLISVAGLAEDKKTEKKPQAVKKTGEVKQQEPKESNDIPDKKKLTWPRPYRPSEEIRADSVVPFPADI